MNPTDPLIGYRVSQLEEGHKMLAEAVEGLSRSTTEIVRQLSIAKWVFAAVFGVLQPLLVIVLANKLV
jgi:hypothetical protein